jgi:hypothetical protein
MGASGPNKATVSAYIDADKAEYIEERVRGSRSAFVGEIIDFWFEQGCPLLPIEKQATPKPFRPSGLKMGPGQTREGQKPGTPAAQESEVQR